MGRRLTCAEGRHSDTGWIRYYLQTGMFVNLSQGPEFSQTITEEWETRWYCQQSNSSILPGFDATE